MMRVPKKPDKLRAEPRDLSSAPSVSGSTPCSPPMPFTHVRSRSLSDIAFLLYPQKLGIFGQFRPSACDRSLNEGVPHPYICGKAAAFAKKFLHIFKICANFLTSARLDIQNFATKANVGQAPRNKTAWIPAFAGMTNVKRFLRHDTRLHPPALIS